MRAGQALPTETMRAEEMGLWRGARCLASPPSVGGYREPAPRPRTTGATGPDPETRREFEQPSDAGFECPGFASTVASRFEALRDPPHSAGPRPGEGARIARVVGPPPESPHEGG